MGIKKERIAKGCRAIGGDPTAHLYAPLTRHPPEGERVYSDAAIQHVLPLLLLQVDIEAVQKEKNTAINTATAELMDGFAMLLQAQNLED